MSDTGSNAEGTAFLRRIVHSRSISSRGISGTVGDASLRKRRTFAVRRACGRVRAADPAQLLFPVARRNEARIIVGGVHRQFRPLTLQVALQGLDLGAGIGFGKLQRRSLVIEFGAPLDNLGSLLVLMVNLYAGNQYWFSLGATDKAKKLAVAVFDETGKPVQTEKYEPGPNEAAGFTPDEKDGPKAAAGFAPDASGPYYVRIQVLEGETATFCLVYSYK